MTVIGVMICTAKRPEMVKRCITSVMAQKNLPDAFRFEIVVVENDSAPNTQGVINELARSSPVPIHYRLETQRGIPFARNRTLAEARDRGYDWVALIDDDEHAHPDWLSKLISAALLYDADIARGPVIYNFQSKNVPSWWQRFEIVEATTGAELLEAPTNNTLYNAKLFREDGYNLRFDNRLTFGYEDIDFSRRARALGSRIIWVEDAFVEEEVPASRITNTRLLERLASQSAAFAFHAKIKYGPSKAWLRFGRKGLRLTVMGTLLLSVTPLVFCLGEQRGTRHFFIYYAKIIRGAAYFRGLTHRQIGFYEKIDGY